MLAHTSCSLAHPYLPPHPYLTILASHPPTLSLPHQARRRNRIISPERHDPFAEDGDDGPSNSKRTYADVMADQQLDNERQQVMRNIAQKAKDAAEGKAVKAPALAPAVEAAAAGGGRWDAPTPKAGGRWDNATPRAKKNRWDDATPTGAGAAASDAGAWVQ